MKIKNLCFCALFLLAIFLSGCTSCFETTSYPFHYDESEIKSISIVHTLEGYDGGNGLFKYETLVEIEDIDDFLTRFEKIQFRSFQFGDPEEVSPNTNAILVKYNNADFEIITYKASDKSINGEPWNYGRPNCSEEEFNTFINSYLTDNA